MGRSRHCAWRGRPHWLLTGRWTPSRRAPPTPCPRCKPRLSTASSSLLLLSRPQGGNSTNTVPLILPMSSARKNRNKLRLAPVLVPIDHDRESARILSTSNRRKRFASARRCLIRDEDRFHYRLCHQTLVSPFPLRPPKRGNFNRIRIRTEMTFVLAVAPRTNTNPPLSDQLQSHYLHNGFFNQHDNFF